MRLVFPGLLAVLAACSPAAQDDLARDAAKQAVRPILAENPVPGVPLEPAADCLIDNATTDELFALAADAVTGPTASTAEIVARIAARPDAQLCLGREYVNILSGGVT